MKLNPRFPIKSKENSGVGRLPGGGGVLHYISHIGMCPPPPHRVGVLRLFDLNTGIHFAPFGLESGVVFEGTTGVYERILRRRNKTESQNSKQNHKTQNRITKFKTESQNSKQNHKIQNRITKSKIETQNSKQNHKTQNRNTKLKTETQNSKVKKAHKGQNIDAPSSPTIPRSQLNRRRRE